MKYVDTKVVFREVPDELTLAINISGCPVKCPGCHSSYLTQDIGEVLDKETLGNLINANPGISCVSFMGGDADPAFISTLAESVHSSHPGMKTCWYSGRDLDNARPYLENLDFVKVGPYIDEFGPLDKETTNQRFYRIEHSAEGAILSDWTERFKPRFV